MNRQNILKIINIVLMIAFLTTVISVTIYSIIPSNLNGDELVGEIHENAGIVFALFAFLHIAFNWKWIKTQMFKKRS